MCAEQSYQSPVSESRRVSAFLVVEQQPFVARVDVDLVQLRRRSEVDPAGGHERERALDLGREQLVPQALRRVATNCWFHACTWFRSAKPPFVNARSRLSVAADWW